MLAGAACTAAPPASSPPASATATPAGTVFATESVPASPPEEAFGLVGAGDIASCDSPGAAKTADLLAPFASSGQVIFTAGDNAYDRGTAAQLAQCFGPTWGRFKDRIRPAIGNHDALTDSGAPYYDYFGAAAGPRGKGWYSYDLGRWHVVVLDANCGLVACGKGSEQLTWLHADLAAHASRCTVAIWHQPLFSSGPHGGDPAVRPFWDELYAAGAKIVVNGHDHDYERFAPQAPDGTPKDDGIREFVVGTGGASLYALRSRAANSLVWQGDTYGVLQLALTSKGYGWSFVPVAGSTFRDDGQVPAACP